MADKEEEEAPALPPRSMKTIRKKKEPNIFQETVQFTTNQEGLTLQQFYDEYSDKLPVFMMVTQGCLGLSNLTTFSADQTMFCKAFVQQKRVIARDARERNISIPVDYPLKFRVVLSRHKVGEAQLLSEIVEERKLPVQVQFSVPGDVSLSISEDMRRVKELTNLVLVDFCHDTFLVANGVYGRHLDPKSMIVPLYLDDLLLSTVSGVEGVSAEEWKPWLADLTLALEKVELLPNMGDKDITVYSGPLPFEDHVYSYIKPCELISICSPNATDDQKINNDNPKPSPEPEPTPAPEVPPPLPIKRGISLKENVQSEDGSHLENLTISQFSDVLKKLKLNKFVDRFVKRQVDGVIAQDLTEDILKAEFHMGGFEVLKLMKYIRTGHIPK